MEFCGPVSYLRESKISDLESPSNFQVKEEEKNLNLWSREWFEGKYNIGFGIPIKFPSQRRKELFKSVKKQWNYALIKNAK